MQTRKALYRWRIELWKAHTWYVQCTWNIWYYTYSKMKRDLHTLLGSLLTLVWLFSVFILVEHHFFPSAFAYAWIYMYSYCCCWCCISISSRSNEIGLIHAHVYKVPFHYRVAMYVCVVDIIIVLYGHKLDPGLLQKTFNEMQCGRDTCCCDEQRWTEVNLTNDGVLFFMMCTHTHTHTEGRNAKLINSRRHLDRCTFLLWSSKITTKQLQQKQLCAMRTIKNCKSNWILCSLCTTKLVSTYWIYLK